MYVVLHRFTNISAVDNKTIEGSSVQLYLDTTSKLIVKNYILKLVDKM